MDAAAPQPYERAPGNKRSRLWRGYPLNTEAGVHRIDAPEEDKEAVT